MASSSLHYICPKTPESIAYFDPVRRNAGEPSAAAPLGTLRIAGAKLVDQGQTLLLATDPHPRVARYELVLGPPRESGQTFIYDLSGVEATWSEPPSAAFACLNGTSR